MCLVSKLNLILIAVVVFSFASSSIVKKYGCTESTTYIPDPFDCSSYLQCVHGQFMSRPCAPGTHFNRILSVRQFQLFLYKTCNYKTIFSFDNRFVIGLIMLAALNAIYIHRDIIGHLMAATHALTGGECLTKQY